MKTLLTYAFVFIFACCVQAAGTEKPLRIFIRAGVKTHGPGQHDHPRFLKDWTELLNQRGAQATGSMNFPNADELAATDVLILFAGDAGNISPEQRVDLDSFLKRGGGLVVIHDALTGRDPEWFKTVIGGAWEYGHAKYFEGPLSFYYVDHTHPITRDAADFEFKDEEYYELNMLPEAHILAGAYRPGENKNTDIHAPPDVKALTPQMWTYEKDNYRAFVSIPGHNATTFDLPFYRAVLLRGITWAGKRDADSLVSKDELASFSQPAVLTPATVSTPLPASFKWTPGDTHVLIVGGGTSHNFKRWFGSNDLVTLSAMEKVSVNYTENMGDILPALKDVDVLFLSGNQPVDDPKLRQALFDFADAGHGLLMLHAGLWYSWKDWPEYHQKLSGAGARSHDKYGEFEVKVTDPHHAIMVGVPETFRIKDELYHVELESKGLAIEPLAEGKNLTTGKNYPVVWITKHPKARIVCITLGHDAGAHDLDAYKTILKNSLKWVAQK